MRKTVLYTFKIIAAAVISLVILSLFSAAYFSPPIAEVQPDGITNYKNSPDTRWTYMSEGFGYGKTDSMGYNNAYYDDLTDPDIVFAGSSHLEAWQVPSDANCVYLLNEMLDKDDNTANDYKCLNIGTSGHFFETTACNYEYIAERFSGAEYIVIEVFNAEYSSDVLDSIIGDEYHAPMPEKGFLYKTLQKIPFLRLMYKNYGETLLSGNAAPDAPIANAPVDKEAEMAVYTEKMNIILSEIAETSAKNGITPIILMHERFWENEDGNIVMETNQTYEETFKSCCEENGIKVIDVSSAMVSEYKDSAAYSYGFANSTPGEGHLNETGHRIVAEKVYGLINEMEAAR